VFRRTDLPETHALHRLACGMKDEIGIIIIINILEFVFFTFS